MLIQIDSWMFVVHNYIECTLCPEKKATVFATNTQWGKLGVHMDIVISLRILFNIIFVSASVSHCQSIIWIVLLFAAIHRAEYTITSNFWTAWPTEMAKMIVLFTRNPSKQSDKPFDDYLWWYNYGKNEPMTVKIGPLYEKIKFSKCPRAPPLCNTARPLLFFRTQRICPRFWTLPHSCC